MRRLAVLAVCVLASCTTRDQWVRTASTLEVGYGWNQGDMDSPAGSKDYDQDSTSVWLTLRPLAAFEPPREVRIVNSSESSAADWSKAHAAVPATSHRWSKNHEPIGVERCAICNRTRFECERDIDEAREELEACRARELVAQGRVARGGSQDGDPARSVPASSSPGLSTGTTISLFAMLGLVISALAYALLPSLRKKVEWWFAAPRVRRATKRRVEFAQEPRKT